MRLREKRHELGLNQSVVAKKCNLDRSYLSKIEKGESIPSVYTLIEISNVLNINVVDLFLSEEDYKWFRLRDTLIQNGFGIDDVMMWMEIAKKYK